MITLLLIAALLLGLFTGCAKNSVPAATVSPENETITAASETAEPEAEEVPVRPEERRRALLSAPGAYCDPEVFRDGM